MGQARKTAEDKEYVVALKDSRSVVSDGTEVYVNVSGNHGMATGGSGDVLAGTIAGLMSGGVSTFEAAKDCVYIHCLSGYLMVQKKGYYGLMASDLITGLSEITKECRS